MLRESPALPLTVEYGGTAWSTYSEGTFLSQPAIPADSLIKVGGACEMDNAVSSALLLASSRELRASARALRIDIAEARLRAKEAVARARQVLDAVAKSKRERQESLKNW